MIKSIIKHIKHKKKKISNFILRTKMWPFRLNTNMSIVLIEQKGMTFNHDFCFEKNNQSHGQKSCLSVRSIIFYPSSIVNFSSTPYEMGSSGNHSYIEKCDFWLLGASLFPLSKNNSKNMSMIMHTKMIKTRKLSYEQFTPAF